jgi:uncharacterized membrane protein (UPF0127 family)
MNKFVIQLVSLIAACVILFFISRQLIDDHAVPSLSDFMASSTADLASSTQYAASSTGATDNASTTASTLPSIDLRAPLGIIHSTIADTDALRQQGLSDRPSLPVGQGMLFVFDTPGPYGFWMKDMLFSLDIVWISADKTVVGVSKDLNPDTYPASFTPPSPISYVLEINAGSADSFGLVPGAKVGFDLKVN